MTVAVSLACRAFSVDVEIDDAGVIVRGPVLARKFIGQPLDSLCAWMRKYGGFRVVAQGKPNADIFDAIATADPAGENGA